MAELTRCLSIYQGTVCGTCFFFFFVICVWLHRELSTVKGKKNWVLYHSFPPCARFWESFWCCAGNVERTDNENRVILWWLISDHGVSVAFLFAHWGRQEKYRSSHFPTKSTPTSFRTLLWARQLCPIHLHSCKAALLEGLDQSQERKQCFLQIMNKFCRMGVWEVGWQPSNEGSFKPQTERR